MLGLTFANPADYDLIQEDDVIDIVGLESFAPAKQLIVVLNHKDGSTNSFLVNHTYNEQQIKWFQEGAALNIIRKNMAN